MLNIFRYYSIALHGIRKHRVVPDIIDIIPSDLAEVVYPNDVRVEIATELKPIQVKEPPIIRWAAHPNLFYTISLTDPDAPSNRNPILREWHHWLVGNIPGDAIEKGETLTEYIGAGPPRGSGLHRYVFLVFQQKDRIQFEEQRLTNDSVKNRGKFSIRKFAQKYNLGNPIAANFFHAQWDDYVPILYTQLKMAADSP
ncbi:protein D2-like [Photinus pyralis]|uniref:Phosphatidylethanolamine-binding protein n=1 Tax=Photinus pyralis TaxID=7054 RepID=A0A1Y1K6V4_PHOPY|nr:protein D2-like [Photinus pyralis]